MIVRIYHHLTTTLHLTLKMTAAQAVETSVTNNSLSKDDPHPDDHTKQITDTPGFKQFTTVGIVTEESLFGYYYHYHYYLNFDNLVREGNS